ncbi:ETS-related transcription factor Elf-3 [Biomphalaria glabrata]|uniref:ETS-related transcription factor Elf-3-like n=1 Tax=Biomphalaria glabrata TaxID=6526 RepID=A0A9W3BLS2_BIOGL|nr:ETS-related transcription factor Elf-3-like [Biomphalaria glabrata]XP_055900470.1 ETS-related transcription factor Elf-3-like [Biomphalaria glabrata]XP_055900471.1 ETS-related transcription factor Elf-3-like [Biomphalaria glabrata]KAI8760080.1 ETS-related transcription factor Elf-3-like; partial [Biomphalaria glabrata]
MPSASPLYTYSSVYTEPQTPYVLSGEIRNNETDCIRSTSTANSVSSNNHNNITNSNHHCPGSNANLYNMDLKNGNGFSGTSEYDPVKYLSAMAEQSLTGNFTRSLFSSSCGNRDSHSTSGNMYTNIEHYDRGAFSSLSSSSSIASSSPPLSPASSCFAYPNTSDPGSSNDFLTNDNASYHVTSQTNPNQPSNFLRNDSPFGQSSTSSNQSIVGFTESRTACKKSYPSCPSEQALLDSDRLLSWTRHHPENWSSSDVLDWIFFVAQERGLDMQDFRGENFQNLTGAQLCQMGLGDFTQLEPRFGRIIYEMLKNLLCGVSFRKPLEPDQMSTQCEPMSPFSSSPCPPTKSRSSLQGYSHTSYHGVETDVNSNGIAQNETSFFKQEKCTNLQSDIDITSYDFDLDDTPCLASSQCSDQYQNEYGMYPMQYPPQDTPPMRTPCCYPTPPFTAQLPRRRPGRPRVKGLIEEERATKDKKVKNQHLWEFIYETLMNPAYNPQFLRWENQRDGVFRFVQSEAVAQLWGGRKNNENMTYEKLSRAMRHYYRRGILERVEGRRLVYKFSLKAMERVRENRHH